MSPSPGASCAGCWPSFRGSEIVAEAGNIIDAAREIEASTPELLFLDIKMPGGTGFDLLAKLEHVPRVIFTTAYDDHAVQAFEVNALDYLLKPIEPERLAGALARARGPLPTQSACPSAQLVERLFIRDGARCWFVPLNEVCLDRRRGQLRAAALARRSPAARPSAQQPRRAPRPAALLPREPAADHQRRVHRGRRARHQRQLHVQLRGGPEVEISRRQARCSRR
jgi:two-component system LytT family response regulator